MATTLAFEEHLRALESSGARLAELAAAAGSATRVPTCGSWTVAHLVAHQAMVHRWATSHIRREGGEAPSQTAIRQQQPDLLGYYRAGHRALLDALRAAPPGLEALRFLADAPAPRAFWARRQAHETTIHMVDALAASVGRPPTSAEAGVDTAVAVDGVDELLRGFFTRGRSKLYDGTVFTFAVTPTDSSCRWLVHVDERLTVTDLGPDRAGDAAFVGTAAQLYLGLWNRGDEITVEGDQALLERWRRTQRVRWS